MEIHHVLLGISFTCLGLVEGVMEKEGRVNGINKKRENELAYILSQLILNQPKPNQAKLTCHEEPR